MARVITMSSGKTIEVKLNSIKDIKEAHPKLEKAELSFEFEFIDKDGDKWTEKSLKTLQSKDWNKRFYLNTNGYVTYTRYQTLNALAEIFKARGDKDIISGLENKALDIDLFIGKKFNAVLLKNQNDETYCDWTETFRANGVQVPNLDQKDNSQVVEASLAKKNDGLPF